MLNLPIDLGVLQGMLAGLAILAIAGIVTAAVVSFDPRVDR